MKKIILIMSILILALSTLPACNISGNFDNNNNANIHESNQSENNEVVGFQSHASSRRVVSFEESIINSYLIIEAQLKSIESHIANYPGNQKVQTGYNYTFNNISVLKGQYDEKEIKVRYTNYLLEKFSDKAKSFNEVGAKYYLILCRKFSVYRDEDLYLPYNYIVIKDNENEINIYSTEGKSIEKKFTKDSFSDNIKNISDTKSSEGRIANWGVEFIDSKKIDEIYKFSDLVVVVETKEAVVDGGSTIFANCEVIECYKGQFNKSRTIIFSAKDFELNKKYLLLLNDEPGSYFLSSKNSCIPIEDTEKYEEYMKYISK